MLFRQSRAALICMLATLAVYTGSVATEAPRPNSGGGKFAVLDTLPDWTGYWATDDESFARIRQTSNSPDPNNPNVAKLKKKYWDYRMINKVQNKGVDGKGAYNNAMDCIPDGMPSMMSIPIEYEFVMAPGAVYVHTSLGSIRRIYTDGRKLTDDVVASFNGYSLGHWEGNTLVVETVRILNKAEMFVGMRQEGETRVVERMQLASKDKFQIDTVVYNDTMLDQPFKYRRTYRRIPELYEALCMENNRDNNAEVDLTPPPIEGSGK